MVTAGFDPLRDDGANYAEALRGAGVEVEYRCYDDQIHGFMGMGILPDSLALATEVCDSMGRLMRRVGSEGPAGLDPPLRPPCQPRPLQLRHGPNSRNPGSGRRRRMAGGVLVRRRIPGRFRIRTRCWSCPPPAAYEHPERLVVRAGEWFAPLGGQVEGLMVLSRADAEDGGAADGHAGARFIYVGGSSPMHIRSVLKKSKVWEALVEAWSDGAVVVGSSGAAMALTDPMVDARGGGLTIGLGLLTGLAVVPHFGDTHEDEHGEKLHRSVQLAPAGTPVAGIPERTALIRDPERHLAFGRGRGRWRSSWTAPGRRPDSAPCRPEPDRPAGPGTSSRLSRPR